MRKRGLGRSIFLAAAVGLIGAGFLAADSYDERRTEAGLKLFRALLAADLDLKSKADSEGRLHVVFFYTDDHRRAEELSKEFGKLELPTVLESSPDATFAPYEARPPAGIFLVQSPDSRALAAIVKFGIAHHIVVYSPFEGHVESGVLGGLSIEAQVRPYLNLTTLKASNIAIKDFFLRVAKVYR